MSIIKGEGKMTKIFQKNVSLILVTLILSITIITFAKMITNQTILNYYYYLNSINRKINLSNGIYKNDKFKISVEKYSIWENDDKNISIVKSISAIILLYQTHKNKILELTSLINTDDQIIQSNNIILTNQEAYIENLKIYQEQYGTIGLSTLTIISLEMYQNKKTIKKDYLLTFKNGQYIIEDFKEENIPVVKKPALYLYPKQKSKIKVKLNINGKIIKSEPYYNNEWEVEADPSGKIYYQSKEYKYLFYENTLNIPPKLEENYIIISHKNLYLLKSYFQYLGLNETESTDFYNYLLQELNKPENKSNYYKISKVDNNFLEENMKIDITPKPDQLLRVILLIQPTNKINKNEKIDQIPVDLKHSIRNNNIFTVVEWGSIIKNSRE